MRPFWAVFQAITTYPPKILPFSLHFRFNYSIIYAMKDLFSVLDLPWGADEPQIRKAYRRLARENHPDVNPDDPAACERFKEISAAYQVLSDAVRRDAYLRQHDFAAEIRSQRTRTTEPETSSPVSAEVEPEPARDILVRLYVTLEELALGVTRKIRVKRRSACPTCGGLGHSGGACPACRGSGHVPDLLQAGSGRLISCRKCGGSGLLDPSPCNLCNGSGRLLAESTVTVGVPPGADDQSLILIRGQGHNGIPGLPSGDLKVAICQKDHPYLTRQGRDLVYRCGISLSQWLAGSELRVPSLEGSLTLKIEPGSKPEGTLRLRGRGLPGPGGIRGDLLVYYRLCIPTTLTHKQYALLQKLENTPGFTPELDAQGFTPGSVPHLHR